MGGCVSMSVFNWAVTLLNAQQVLSLGSIRTVEPGLPLVLTAE